MAAVLTLVILAAFGRIKSAKASPMYTDSSSNQSYTSVAQCTNYTVPLTVTSENFVFNISKFENNFDVVDLVTDIARKDANVTFNPVSGKQNVTATYTLAGTFCSPKSPSGHEKTVLLATHGIAYDRRYWNSAYKPEEYSFVEAAIGQGYSVFFYDRLGTGESQKVSGYTNQAAPQVEIIAGLADKLRSGSYTGSVGKPNSIVLVGHSFGSYTSNLVLGKYPNHVDAAVLTGIAYAGLPDYAGKVLTESFAARIATSLPGCHDADLDTGYLNSADIYAHVNGFFKKPAYEIAAAQYAFSIVQPFGITEFLSTALSSIAAPAFEGPVFITSGEFDLPACAGECYSSFAEQEEALKSIFAKSKKVGSYVHPGAGHGVNFATNATGFYQEIFGFLGQNGL